MEMDGLGAQSNAFTSQESTSYYAKAKKENVNEILDVVADMYLNPTFDSREIEKEKASLSRSSICTRIRLLGRFRAFL